MVSLVLRSCFNLKSSKKNPWERIVNYSSTQCLVNHFFTYIRSIRNSNPNPNCKSGDRTSVPMNVVLGKVKILKGGEKVSLEVVVPVEEDQKVKAIGMGLGREKSDLVLGSTEREMSKRMLIIQVSHLSRRVIERRWSSKLGISNRIPDIRVSISNTSHEVSLLEH